jgi:hypothetical protein
VPKMKPSAILTARSTAFGCMAPTQMGGPGS